MSKPIPQWKEVGIGGTIRGTVCGLQRKKIDNIEEIKCPICGEPLHITELSVSEEERERYEVVTGINSYMDDANTRHRFVYGREVLEQTYPVTLSCHNLCAEIKIKLTDVSIGYDKQLRHEISRQEL